MHAASSGNLGLPLCSFSVELGSVLECEHNQTIKIKGCLSSINCQSSFNNQFYCSGSTHQQCWNPFLFLVVLLLLPLLLLLVLLLLKMLYQTTPKRYKSMPWICKDCQSHIRSQRDTLCYLDLFFPV